ncbi:MAG TPA: hypothetical protein PLA90_18095 [Candidatus Sumerlaeota bacterium]|nr:hypothetical protein [Candidatus Sumerlaeota bacterium]HPS03450.1 hypothetical protein [Candidatus Sumerlaeota bacterium]
MSSSVESLGDPVPVRPGGLWGGLALAPAGFFVGIILGKVLLGGG